MTETTIKKVKTVSTISRTVEVPANQQKQLVEKKQCAYECECKKCERCSSCDYIVNGLRRFYERDNKLYCENCLQNKRLITLKGITTSQIRTREKLSDTPAYCFLKTEKQEKDIPVIFRIKEGDNWIKPKIKKGSYLQIKGQFAIKKEYPKGCLMRKSFTAISYQLLNSQPATEKKVNINTLSDKIKLNQIEQNIK